VKTVEKYTKRDYLAWQSKIPAWSSNGSWQSVASIRQMNYARIIQRECLRGHELFFAPRLSWPKPTATNGVPRTNQFKDTTRNGARFD
jgi:hypothetical protein